MEIRLNKLISESGLCSRREADKFIEEGRVTVNGHLPQVGQKVSESDNVMLDDIQVKITKRILEQLAATPKKVISQPAKETSQTEPKRVQRKENTPTNSSAKEGSATGKSKGLRPGKYVKYNKYAAARHAARNGESLRKEKKNSTVDPDLLKEALQPKFGKSLSRSAVAQRIMASPKSAALRKTSRNNPINKAKRQASRNK